ncbi:MAG: ketopantoate reductase family protein [Nitrospirae bacterium]|nr:ketopantoate reductase family protein [Nitrospirota bacterium]
MRIVIFGAGAIGSAIGAHLAPENEVTLVGRPAHMAAIRRDGLRLEGILGRRRVRRLAAADSLPHGTPFDAALVTTKSFDTGAAADLLRSLSPTPRLVCSFQNGLGNADVLRKTFPRTPVGLARVIFGAKIVRPGRVRITVFGAPVEIGPDPRQSRPLSARGRPLLIALARSLARAGLPTVYNPAAWRVLWMKVLYNGALNPLSALFGRTYGEVCEHPVTRAICLDTLREGFAVAEAEGARLPFRSADSFVRYFLSRMLPPTAAHRASMYEDLVSGRRTEIDALCGEIVRRARRHGLPTPQNRLLWSAIKQREGEGRNRR